MNRELAMLMSELCARWGTQVLAETKRKQMELISTLQEDILSPEEEEALRASYNSEEDEDGAPAGPGSAFAPGAKRAATAKPKKAK